MQVLVESVVLLFCDYIFHAMLLINRILAAVPHAKSGMGYSWKFGSSHVYFTEEFTENFCILHVAQLYKYCPIILLYS